MCLFIFKNIIFFFISCLPVLYYNWLLPLISSPRLFLTLSWVLPLIFLSSHPSFFSLFQYSSSNPLLFSVLYFFNTLFFNPFTISSQFTHRKLFTPLLSSSFPLLLSSLSFASPPPPPHPLHTLFPVWHVPSVRHLFHAIGARSDNPGITQRRTRRICTPLGCSSQLQQATYRLSGRLGVSKLSKMLPINEFCLHTSQEKWRDTRRGSGPGIDYWMGVLTELSCDGCTCGDTCLCPKFSLENIALYHQIIIFLHFSISSFVSL